MNVSSIILALTSLGLGSASVYLYTELDAARGRADAEIALRQDQEARVKALEATRLDLEQRLQGLTGAAEWPAPPPAGKADAKMQVATNRMPAEANREDEPFFANARNAMREMMANPENRRAMQAQHKMALRAMYKDLAGELHLSADQANQLLDLLAQQQMERMQEMRENRGDRNALSQANADLEQKNAAELTALLGDKYSQYQEYQQSLGERMQVEQIGVQFAAANLPLADSQKKQLITAMVEERKTLPPPTWSQDASPQDNMARMRAWQQDYEKRIKDRASSVLSSQQLAQYEELQKAQGAALRGMVGFAGRGGGGMAIALPGVSINTPP